MTLWSDSKFYITKSLLNNIWADNRDHALMEYFELNEITCKEFDKNYVQYLN